MLFKSLTAPFISDCLEQILNQLFKAVLLAVNSDRTPPEFIPHALHDLAKLEARPSCLTKITYEWCSAIYANREKFKDWESLLLNCLELGFRHLDPWRLYTRVTLTHTEHHRGLADVAFKSQKGEVIADFLHAWTTAYHPPEQAGEVVRICTGHLVGLHNLVPFSPRLRRLVIRFVERAGCKGFEGAGMEKLTELLDHLHVTVEEIDLNSRWLLILLGVIWSSEGAQRLSHWYWELLVELAISESWWLGFEDIHGPEIVKSLIDDQEWSKLECWIGIVWMLSEWAGIAEEDLEHSMLLLFRQRPGAARRLEQWMEQRSQLLRMDVPESFQRILTQAHEAVQ